jgi:hypothetical protein
MNRRRSGMIGVLLASLSFLPVASAQEKMNQKEWDAASNAGHSGTHS